jgi:hypothetical protein
MTTVRAINTAPSYQSVGVLESEVEQVLGADLLREPIENAHARAESLRDPLILAQLLDDWSLAGKWTEFRRPHLGRIVNLRDVRSRNIYFYTLDVLIETREPPTPIEEPDKEAHTFPVQREQDRWQVKLPRPSSFEDDPGRAEIISGSERVISCPRCEGNGHEVCPQCKGSRRILQNRTISSGAATNGGAIHEQDTVVRMRNEGGAAVAVAPQVEVRQTLVACPTCNGAGALPCGQCEGIGRLVQRKVFNWRREAIQRRSHDDMPNLDERALRDVIEPIPVYEERAFSLKREWAAVPGLRRLIADVERQTSADARVVMAEVTVRMIPYTVVQLDLGHQDVVVEDDAASHSRAKDDTIHTVHIVGFENQLYIGNWAIDSGRRVLVYLPIFLGIVVIILLLYVFLML